MNETDERFIYSKAIELWGKEFQIKMAVEECAELIVKLSKFGRNVNGSKPEEICDEIADVEIMMGQLRLIFNDDFIAERKKYKLNRLMERVGLK